MNLLRLRSFPTRRASDLVGDAAETRGPDPAGTQLPAASATEQPPGLLEATQLTGLVPGVPLRFDPAQGWLQLDPATGFPLCEELSGLATHRLCNRHTTMRARC